MILQRATHRQEVTIVSTVGWLVPAGLALVLSAGVAWAVAPVAYNVRMTCKPSVSTTNDVSFTDPDWVPPEFLQVITPTNVTAPLHGTVAVTPSGYYAAPTFVYKPTGTFKGEDRFTFRLYDGVSYSGTATCRVQVRDSTNRAGNVVLLLVRDTLYPVLSNEVNRLKQDLIDEGYTAAIHALPLDTAESLWNHIKAEYDNTNQWLEGVILIGDLAKPQVQALQDPYTLVYNDLVLWNMTFLQTVGSVLPRDLRVWVSRFCASGSPYGSETELLRRALDANHAARKGIARLPYSACSYPDYYTYEITNVWPTTSYLGAPDALKVGGDLFQEDSHGDPNCYMGGAFRTADLMNSISQQRVCIISSCQCGIPGGIVNHHILTRGGGTLFAVGGSEVTAMGDVIIGYSGEAAFRDRLKEKEAWGSALLRHYPFGSSTVSDRTMYYGDLSMPIKVSPSNAMPNIVSFTTDAGVICPGQPVTFSVQISDPDGAGAKSPYVPFRHQIEWFMNGYNYGMNNPTYTACSTNGVGWTNQVCSFPGVGTFTVRAEVMDEWQARTWREMAVTVVSPPPPLCAITNIVDQSFVTAGTNLTIMASAVTPVWNRTLSKVEFYRNGIKIGEAASAPYSCIWSNVPVGSFALMARAIDSEGVTTDSAAMHVAAVSSGSSGPCQMRMDFFGYTGTEPLTNFPVLVVLGPSRSGFGYNQFISTNGWDLRFTASDLVTELPYEIEKWNSIGASYVWVRVPTLTSNAWIVASWGDTNRTARPAYTTNGAVWIEGFKAVWHLNDNVVDEADGGTNHFDSTTNRLNGIQHGNSRVEAVCAGGQDFDGGAAGAADYVAFPGVTWTPTRFTVSYWLRPRSLWNWNQGLGAGQGWNYFLCHTETGGGLYVGTDVGTRFFSANTAGAYTINQWSYITFTFDSGNAAIYSSGNLLSVKGGMANPAGPWAGFLLNSSMDGVADEVRLSGVARSADWVWAEYQNMSANDTFCAYGAVQTDASVDANGNGLPDAWETQYFGGTNTPSGAPTNDPDGDGMNNLNEFYAGTIPTNRLSVLCIVDSAFQAPSSEFVIRWQSASNKVYTVQAATNLLSGFISNLLTNIRATPPENVHTDNTATAGQNFYRVRLE